MEFSIVIDNRYALTTIEAPEKLPYIRAAIGKTCLLFGFLRLVISF